MSKSDSVAALAQTIRQRQSAMLVKWAEGNIRQSRARLRRIKQTKQGKVLIGERKALDAEYLRDIEPIESRWTTLKGLHIEDGKVIQDGAELKDAKLVCDDYYHRRNRWQECWNALCEIHIGGKQEKLGTATAAGFIPAAAAFAMLKIGNKTTKEASKIMASIRAKTRDTLKSEKRGNQWFYELESWSSVVKLISVAGGVRKYTDPNPREIASSAKQIRDEHAARMAR